MMMFGRSPSFGFAKAVPVVVNDANSAMIANSGKGMLGSRRSSLDIFVVVQDKLWRPFVLAIGKALRY